MRLADLLLSSAEDSDGTDLGQVHDVSARLSVSADGRHRLVVEGVVTGVGSVGTRLGYLHGEVSGPWLLAVVLRWLGRHSRYVPWEHLRWDPARGHVDVLVGRDELVHPSEAP